MPDFKLAFILVAAVTVLAIGTYYFSRKDDDDDDYAPPRHPYYSTPSYGTTQNQTQARRPPPSPYSFYRPPATDAHSQTRPWAPTVVPSGLRSGEPASIEDLEFAKKLREQARRRGREMSEARGRAKSAQKKGHHGAAHAHRQEAIAHESAMKELDKRAARIIFREKNKNRKDGMIDLHDLHVAEAVGFAKEELKSAKSRGDKVVRFIVGKGLHTEDGVAKIRPALAAFCTKQGLTHALDPKNTGVLVVRLD